MAGTSSTRGAATSGISSFFFKPVKPGNASTATNTDDPGKEAITFLGYIDGLSTNSSPSWDMFYDMGRSDPKVMYKSPSRNVQINFKVVSERKSEHGLPSDPKSNYNKLQKLGELTYPIIQSGKGFNGVHVIFVVGKILSGYGYITSLDYSWDNETPWVDDLPIITDVSISIQILTDFKGNMMEYKGGTYNYFGGVK